jgi:hypothetical protein
MLDSRSWVAKPWPAKEDIDPTVSDQPGQLAGRPRYAPPLGRTPRTPCYSPASTVVPTRRALGRSGASLGRPAPQRKDAVAPILCSA